LVADPRKDHVLYGRVVQHGDSRRALTLALELVLALRSHGWIDLNPPRRRRCASDDEQSVESGGSVDEQCLQCSRYLDEQSLKSGDSVDNCYDNGQRPHSFHNLLTHQLLDPTAYMF
jgi:hypothetical protein